MGKWNRMRIWRMCAATVLLAGAVAQTVYGAGPGEGPGGPGEYGPGVYTDVQGNPVSGVIEKGISVSKYQNRASESQGGIDWQQVKNSGVGFVMVRLGYHNDLDPYFGENMTGASQAGLKTGVFFYTQALDVATAAAEGEFVVSQIKGYPIGYPVAYDLESKLILDAGLTRQQITDQAKAFCQVISQAGYRPMIYANQEWLNNHIDASQLKDDGGQPYDIWYARYGTVHEYPGRTIWQSTDSGTVRGITGNVTTEYAFADYSSLIPANGWSLVAGSWYYMENYRRHTGWLDVDGKRYYMEGDGKMVCGVTKNIDGTDWTFGSDGAVVQ